jgi:hypothetical protein
VSAQSGADSPERPQAIFASFVGSGRSGTTLVRAMFNSHPDLSVPPEAPYVLDVIRRRGDLERNGTVDIDRLVSAVFRPGFKFESSWEMSRADVTALLSAAPITSAPDAIRAIFRGYASREGKRLYADKTPNNVVAMPLLAEAFGEMRFVHIVRDGRDVAMSFVDAPFGGNSLGIAAVDWRRRVRTGRLDGAALGPDRYTEMHYEALVGDPEATLRTVCPFVGVEFRDEMLSYTERTPSILKSIPHPTAHQSLLRPPTVGLRDWRRDLSAPDRRLVDAIAASQLRPLGYTVDRVSPWSRARALAVRTQFLLLRARSVIDRRARRAKQRPDGNTGE